MHACLCACACLRDCACVRACVREYVSACASVGEGALRRSCACASASAFLSNCSPRLPRLFGNSIPGHTTRAAACDRARARNQLGAESALLTSTFKLPRLRCADPAAGLAVRRGGTRPAGRAAMGHAAVEAYVSRCWMHTLTPGIKHMNTLAHVVKLSKRALTETS